MEETNLLEQRAVNRLVLFLVVFAGTAAGMLPYVAFLDSALFSWLYLGGSALVAGVVSLRLPILDRPRPSVQVHALATLAGAGFGVSMAMFGLGIHGVAFGTARGLVWLGGLVGYTWTIDAHSAASMASGTLALVFSLLTLAFTPVPRTLHPDGAASASAYDPLLRSGALLWKLPLALGGLAVSLAAWVLWPADWGWHLIALALIVAASSDVLTAVSVWSPTAALGSESVLAVQKLYQSLGYATVLSPRTKASNADVDSLLKIVDLLVTRGQEALAVHLIPPSRNERAVSAADASILPIAARALARQLRRGGTGDVTPVLILVGRDVGADLAALCREEGIQLVQFGDEVVRETLASRDNAELQPLATRYLGRSNAPTQTQPADRPAASGAT